MTPVSILCELEDNLLQHMDCEVLVEGSADFGLTIIVKTAKNGQAYYYRHIFSGAELKRIKEQNILFDYLYHKILDEFKEKGLIEEN